MAKLPSYNTIILEIFRRHHVKGSNSFEFTRSEIEDIARMMEVSLPKNQGDLLYTFRFRRSFPKEITDTAPPGLEWIVELAGVSLYRFRLSKVIGIIPNPAQLQIKIPNATPEIVTNNALTDEQALLAVVRYNRLVDIFLGLTAYSLQNHLRTTVKGIGQIEIDEVYVGISKKGSQFVIPVQAKGGRDKIGSVQAMQDIAWCESKFPYLICKPVAAQFLSENVVVLFELNRDGSEIRIVDEKHYKLVAAKDITNVDLEKYRSIE